MRISKSRLKQIIKEETGKILSEQPRARERSSLASSDDDWWNPLGIGTDRVGEPSAEEDAARAAELAQDAATEQDREKFEQDWVGDITGTPKAQRPAAPPAAPASVAPVGDVGFNKILNRLEDQGSIDKQTWRIATRTARGHKDYGFGTGEQAAMKVLMDRANIYHDSPSYQKAAARAAGEAPMKLGAGWAPQKRMKAAADVEVGGVAIEDFQQAIKAMRTTVPGEDIIGRLPEGPIRDGYTAKFKDNVRSILADYPDLEMDAVRRQAQNLTNDDFVPRLRQMAEKGRGLTPPPESMMASPEDPTDPDYGLRETKRRRISIKQLQRIVKEELSAALNQKKRLNKERMLAEQSWAEKASQQVKTGIAKAKIYSQPKVDMSRAGMGEKGKVYSGMTPAQIEKHRLAKISSQPAGSVRDQSMAVAGADYNPFDAASQEGEAAAASQEGGKRKISSQKMRKKVNALYKGGQIDKETWRKARRALYKSGGAEAAQQIVSGAVQKGKGKATVAKSAAGQGVTDQDMDRLRKGYMPSSPAGKAQFSKMYNRAKKQYPGQGREALFDIVADSLSKKFSLAANTAQQQKQQVAKK